ncbi:MAG: hypothetical protein HS117_07755 [Verrucomicrobiaceae bacterium]|nr:hypothetical protein [Verrucomicrobiaceae bacterium]
MTLADLSPGALARLEAKLIADVAAPALVPQKKPDGLQLEALATPAGKTFLMEDLRKVIYTTTRHYLESGSLRVFVNRMIREGKVAVEQHRTGRNGSVYRCLIPPSTAG